MNPLQQIARKAATAGILQAIGSPERSEQLLAQLRELPDSALDSMAALYGIPEEQHPIFRAHMRGQQNPFLDELGGVDGKLHIGDVILMTGSSARSKALVAAQKPFYLRARSSHVAIVHADFVCLDAIPGVGVSNRLIQEVLSDVDDDWRVIRFKGVSADHIDLLMRACAFYLAQPYKLRPRWRSGKESAYCSELARKIFLDCGITRSGIPVGPIVAPAHFDELADMHPKFDSSAPNSATTADRRHVESTTCSAHRAALAERV
ncbi:MAG: YiiX/YebB-like N1pC/P60 family cysteine hydrolase [Inhella sp.]|jgi:hypothetical protein|uniref:YiiX/YebB-like N1pC/P60 family cysteine hydrolase n=1 Tax=Inhella sp. TaxID=1921806 RepID=UPI0022C9906F|nr:YiiX/YebB-like N1pC/P60 family cysteine hydrolase [Inhella sp.]MCZ8235021.1 YiiX/YebB-like N1pC/P60 family cysteine hydrolase [Inhella sp.]